MSDSASLERPCNDLMASEQRQREWSKRLEVAQSRRNHRKNVVDDGFFSYMAKGARCEGLFEFPVLERPRELKVPEGAVPFSMLGRAAPDDCCVFFEKDPMFTDALVAVDDFLEDLMRLKTVSTPDCSLYVDMPLGLQIANTHMNRLVGHHFQQLGMNVIPTVRWGDWRSYTSALFGEPFAFAGLPKHSIYWIGTYGCSKKRADKERFRDGLQAMIDYLEPEVVLVYGSMPESIFADVAERARFIRYPDWITRQKGGSCG